MNKTTEATEENLNSFIPWKDTDPLMWSIAETVVNKLVEFKIISLTLNHNDQIWDTYFTIQGLNGRIFSKRTKTLTLRNYFDNEKYVIPESSILQIGYPSCQEGLETFIKIADSKKPSTN